MARPKTEAGTTPVNVRLARSKEKLLTAGGRRFNTNLSPEATAALDRIKAVHAFKTDRDALEYAILAVARKLA
jgi:hypothetical protein